MPKQTFFNLPQKKRSRILECAIQEFAEHGYERFSISRMVAAAGIAKGSFYQYFEDKDDLYEHVIDIVIIQRKLRISDEEQPRLLELNLTQFIRTLFRRLVREFSTEPLLMKLGLDFLRHQNEQPCKRIYERYAGAQDDYFPRFIRDEQSRGEIDPQVDAEVLGHMLLGISYYIGARMRDGGALRFDTAFIDDMVDKIEYILTHDIYQSAEQ